MRFADSFGLTDICASAGNYAAVGYALRQGVRCGKVCAGYNLKFGGNYYEKKAYK